MMATKNKRNTRGPQSLFALSILSNSRKMISDKESLPLEISKVHPETTDISSF